jgi:hypothetical protein
MKAYTMKTTLALVIVGLLAIPTLTFAGGRGGGRSVRSYSLSPGTGSKSTSTRVSSYTTQNGTYVPSYRRSTADTKFQNNWSTKGNYNLSTGASGTRITPPAK